MASVPIQIDGVFYPYRRDAASQPIAGSMIGQAFVVGLGVGGGPIMPIQPPDGGPPGGGEPPLGIWGPPGPWPTPPIALPPDPGPIPPVDPTPPANTVIKPAPDSGGWSLQTDASGTVHWAYRPGPGQAQPKRPG